MSLLASAQAFLAMLAHQHGSPLDTPSITNTISTVLSGAGRSWKERLVPPYRMQLELREEDFPPTQMVASCSKAGPGWKWELKLKMLNITRVIIAHRPETIASVERVIALVGGRVAYDGPVPTQPALRSEVLDDQQEPVV